MFGTYCRLGVHVLSPDRGVIKAFHKRLSPLGRSRVQRDARHAWLRELLAIHKREAAIFRHYRF